MICFKHHPQFLSELNDFIQKHASGRTTSEQTMNYLQNLLDKHFCEHSPQFTPKHLGQAEGFDGYLVYWFHMVIPNAGLSRTQNPKTYFLKNNDIISFLCLDSHLQNYKDEKLRKIAKKRLFEIMEIGV